MSETIFSKIIRREIPADIVYEDEQCLAFRDVHPQAPTHILVIPKKPIVNIADASTDDREILGSLLLAVKSIAEKFELKDFRVITNNGAGAGQSVFHLHLHILSGRSFAWPPG